MQEQTLIMAVGSDAVNDLTATEKTAILAKFDDSQELEAAIYTFKLLSKKFKPSYRLGRMYEDLSAKYEHYFKMYALLTAQRAGKLKPTQQSVKLIERAKWAPVSQ